MIKLQPTHLDLAKSLARKVWEKSKHHPDYIEGKIHRNDNIPSNNAENIWAIINQFDLRNQMKVWRMAVNLSNFDKKKNRGNVVAKELAAFIETEQFARIEKEFGIKLTDNA